MFVPTSYDLKPAEDKELDEIMKGLLPIKPRSEGLLFDIFVTNTDSHYNSSEYVFEDIKVPTLVVNAEDDPAADFGEAKEMSQRILRAKFVSVKEGGHMMFGNDDLVAKEVNRFLIENRK
jgi:pimeloyl-ACP methyl ester carboxylesterase